MSFAVGPDAYDRFMGRYSVPLAPKLADFADVVSGQRVLDVGCGPGALTAVLAELVVHFMADPVAGLRGWRALRAGGASSRRASGITAAATVR